MKVIGKERVPIKAWIDHVDVEEQALDQLKNCASMPFIYKHLAAMPDVHWGMGATVGSVIPTVKAIIPAAVGVDIGCGMCAVPTNLTSNNLPESLKEIRHSLERTIPVGFNAHKDGSHLTQQEASLVLLLNNFINHQGIKPKKQRADQQMGSLGGGNHFIELCLDESDRVWIMLHSGSRGIGNSIGLHFIEKAKKDMERFMIRLPDKDLAYLPEGTDHFDDYVYGVEKAQAYASMNRSVMMRLIIKDLMHHFPHLQVDLENTAVNCHHNYITKENHFNKNVWITRKGAVRARKGDLGIIPGSMGAKSYIVEGKGNDDSFHSCSHGAGRVMSRSEAKRTFTVDDHFKATEGIECRKDKDVIDETPMAYKDIDLVMKSQEDLVSIKHTLKQVLCIKG